MSNNIYKTTEFVPQISSGEGPEEIHQEIGSKKRINHQTDDVVVGNLRQPTSVDSSSLQRWQQQQHYENILQKITMRNPLFAHLEGRNIIIHHVYQIILCVVVELLHHYWVVDTVVDCWTLPTATN